MAVNPSDRTPSFTTTAHDVRQHAFRNSILRSASFDVLVYAAAATMTAQVDLALHFLLHYLVGGGGRGSFGGGDRDGITFFAGGSD